MDYNYKIFLLEDTGNYAELDSEDVQMQTTFAISDISDITSKKDTLSINITLKGTKSNNRAFGNLFNQSRYVTNTDEMLFVNYSINSKANCMVFENSMLILQGYLQVSKVYKTNGAINYDCIITGNIVNFFSGLSTRMTDDLDFSRFEHAYTLDNIVWSWQDATTPVPGDANDIYLQRLNNHIYIDGGATAVSLGKGYVYPFINYGERSPSSGITSVNNINNIQIYNMRPAMYVNEYLNAIFGGTALGGSGYTYEVRGTDKFIDNWNRLIIPPNGDYMYQIPDSTMNLATFYSTADSNTTYNYSFGVSVVDPPGLRSVASFPVSPLVNLNCITLNNFQHLSDHNRFTINRNMVADFTLSLGTITVANTSNKTLKVYLRTMYRDQNTTSYANISDELNSYSTGDELYIGQVAPGNTLNKTNQTLNVSQKSFSNQQEFCVMISVESVDGTNWLAKVSLDYQYLTMQLSGDVKYSVAYGDNIIPMPVTGIKQQDFIKSLILLFNLYTYSELHNPKHIIFETYDSFYSKCVPKIIGTSSVDFTKKIDYSKNFTIQPATAISDAYSFVYKSDTDYYNDLYNKTFGEVYGSYGFTNSVTGTKTTKVELVFSPTPVVSFANTSRVAPEIYKQDDTARTPQKSNARILYYNGLYQCTSWRLGTFDNSWNFTPTYIVPLASPTFSYYPMCSHFRYTPGYTDTTSTSVATASTMVGDLNFGLAKEYYFTVGSDVYGARNAYEDFYSNQLGEMTNLNNYFVECYAWMNENDIANLDMKTPIFIQNEFGNAYYKILQVEYNNRFETTMLKLQKINL